MLEIILIVAVILLTIVDIATLGIVWKLFTMHNKKNKDGEYAFIIPDGWCKLQEQLHSTQEKLHCTQEKIVEAITELTEQNKNSTRLLETLTNAVLDAMAEQKRERNR